MMVWSKKVAWCWVWLLVMLGGGTSIAAHFKPFYDRVQSEEGSFFALRPFYSRTVVEEGEIQDVFWPLYSRKSFKDEKSSRALLFYFTHQFDANQDTPRKRRWLFPVLFQGRNIHGENYFALFPLGGTLYEFLGRDRISFFLFPLFSNSQINEVKTTSVFWPIYSRTRGDGIQRDRIFPLFGKTVLENQYEKKFVCWPFWTSADYFYPGNSGRTWILFPICGRAKMENEKTLWVIPPFFRFTQGAEQNRTFCPWPFFQKIDSEKRQKLYLWPLWGKDEYANDSIHRNFLFWPFLWSSKMEQDHRVKTKKMALPFFFLEREFLGQEENFKEPQTEIARTWRIWPLMSGQREGQTSRFRILDLWPIKNSGPIERNWAPLWTIYQRTALDDLTRKDLLWFVWHSERDRSEDRSEWSLLKGLLSYKKEHDHRDLQVLYFIHFER